MTTPNRIDQVTVANAETNARLASVLPAQTGWQPSTWLALGLSVAVSVLASLGTVFAAAASVPLTAPIILGAVVTGLSTGLASFAGLKSAGTHHAQR